MAIDEQRFDKLCDTVARIDTRTANTESHLHDLSGALERAKVGPCARGLVHDQRLEFADIDRRNIWAKTNGIPARLIAVIGITVTVVGGIVGLIVALK